MYDAPGSYSNKFRRVSHERPDRPNHVLIEYVGDESAAAQFPHGNAVNEVALQHPYVRTQPSVLSTIRETDGNPMAIYNDLVTAAPIDSALPAAPRNPDQIRNTHNREKNRVRLTQDALFNVHELGYDTGFIHEMKTIPDLSILMYHPDVLKIFR